MTLRIAPWVFFALLPAGGCSRKSDAANAPRAAPEPTVAREHDGTARRDRDGDESERRLPERALEVRLNGAAASPWRPEQVAAIPAMHVQNKQGEAREAWSVDDVAHKLVGPTARVVAVLGTNAKRVSVDAAPGHTLVLRVTRDGEYKAQWSDGGQVLHDVRGVEVTR
jgi:hypothetical protein